MNAYEASLLAVIAETPALLASYWADPPPCAALVAWTASVRAAEAVCSPVAPPTSVRLAVARGRWQRLVAVGHASVSELRGSARNYRSRYQASVASLEARAAAAWRCS